MKPEILDTSGEPMGSGQEWGCYLHPQDPARLVKFQNSKIDKQTRLELKFYRWLGRRQMNNLDYHPRFYGEVETNPGKRFVVDLSIDFDGSVSRSL